MKTNLKDLVKGLKYEILKGDLHKTIESIAYDSRMVKENTLFVAIPGFVVDGHSFLNQAIASGGNCLIVDREVDIAKNLDVTVIKVEDTRKAMAHISANFFDNPSRKMKVVGITGTNGKTTTIHILKEIYENLGFKVGLIGTIGASIGGESIPCKNTTPESVDLQKILAKMVDDKVDYCFMEVSSHALGLDRAYSTKFYSSIYTNLSPDHLEFHKDMEEYYNTKKKLFFMSEKMNIINIDDEYGKRLCEEISVAKSETIRYGIERESEISANNIRYFCDRIMYNLFVGKDSVEIELMLPGKVNVYNSLAAAAFAFSDGVSLIDIKKGTLAVQGVTGRFETVYKDEDLQVIVDFAHTEDGLKEVINTIRPFTKGRLILVFGVYAAPGEKGRGKRLAMGRTASKYADVIFVTSDNPKNQNPQEIIDEIIEGIKEINSNKPFLSFVDRKEAIEAAIKEAKRNDVLLITGKGHETAQMIGKEAIPFNEKEIVIDGISKYKNKAGI